MKNKHSDAETCEQMLVKLFLTFGFLMRWSTILKKLAKKVWAQEDFFHRKTLPNEKLILGLHLSIGKNKIRYL